MCGDHDITKVTSTDFEFNIFQTKWVFSVTGGIGIFTRPQEEVECNPDAVHSSLVPRRGTSKLSSSKKYLHWNWFDSGRWVIDHPEKYDALRAESGENGFGFDIQSFVEVNR